MAARPTTSQRTGAARAPQAAPARAHVRDFAGSAGAVQIEWDVRPAYDFLFSLSEDAGTTDDLPESDRAWLTSARAALPGHLRAEVDTLVASDIAIHVASFVVEHPELRTVDQLVDGVASVSTVDLIRAMLSDFLRDPETGDLVERCAAGDRTAVAALAKAIPEHKAGFQAMLDDPAAAHRRILEVLRAWADQFRPIESRVSAIIERDHALRAADRGAYQGTDLIERTTGGVRWLPEVGIRRVVLAPSYFSRPYNFVLAGTDWRFFGYPVADDAIDTDDQLAPPPAVVRLHRALGDATRLRILKLLAARDLYLTEIAQQLDLSKPTIKHHLALLRAAGLVTITESANVVYYSLRHDRIGDASSELDRFLRP